MSLLDKAKKLSHRILTDLSGFGVEVTLDDGNGNIANVVGVMSNHHISVDQENVPVNSKKASITISEQALESENYPVRDNDDQVNIHGHSVKYKDSTGVERSYSISEAFPDETVGHIVILLQDAQ